MYGLGWIGEFGVIVATTVGIAKGLIAVARDALALREDWMRRTR